MVAPVSQNIMLNLIGLRKNEKKKYEKFLIKMYSIVAIHDCESKSMINLIRIVLGGL